MSDDNIPADRAPRWAALAAATPARIALGRSGASLPTREILRFGIAHAQARDAVRLPLRTDEVEASLAALGFGTIGVASAAPDRDVYLRRPDLGRLLSEASVARLAEHRSVSRESEYDLALVVADGLSSTAIHQNAAPFLAALMPLLDRQILRLAPIVVATEARVALGDAIGGALGVPLVAVLIGERPGLSSPDSLGIYLTFGPKPGLTDAARNCISNIRPGGLPYPQAAHKLAWLIAEARRLSLSGVGLKDGSGRAIEAGEAPPEIAADR